jgi:hypothetical protein
MLGVAGGEGGHGVAKPGGVVHGVPPAVNLNILRLEHDSSTALEYIGQGRPFLALFPLPVLLTTPSTTHPSQCSLLFVRELQNW